MREFVSFASLLVCATAVHAQTPVRQEPVAPPAAEAAAGTSVGIPAPAIDIAPRSVTADDVSAVRIQAPSSAGTLSDGDAMAQDITAPQNFWWLVGGIVLAGLILAVLL